MFDRGRILRLAARFSERGKLHEALREYGRLVELDPNDLNALHQVAKLETRLGARAGAAKTLFRIGERLVAKGWKLAAIYRFRRLLDVVETLPPETRLRYAEVGSTLERLRSDVADQKKNLEAYDEASLALERNKRDPDVIELLMKMLALQPDNPVFHARLAEAYCRLGMVDDALPSFRLAAASLIELERKTDALRVIERILHFRADPDDALLAAGLYLERGEHGDPMRAVAKLQTCISADPEGIDALAVLARAFDAMGQAERALRVRLETARIAKEAGETELLQDLVSVLVRAAPDDPLVRALSGKKGGTASSAPQLSVRSSFVSVTSEELASIRGALAETGSRSDSSVLDELSFEELSEVWVMPVVSKEARRALDDAEAFIALRLYPKAEYVLRLAVEEDPVCAELREALRSVLRSSGDMEGFVEETVALADLYRQRRFYARARTLVAEALAEDPYDDLALSLSHEIDQKEPALFQSRGDA